MNKKDLIRTLSKEPDPPMLQDKITLILNRQKRGRNQNVFQNLTTHFSTAFSKQRHGILLTVVFVCRECKLNL